MRVFPAELRSRCARVCAVLALWACVAAPSTNARAQEAPERVVLVGPFPEVLVRRIEGQLSDIAWEIVQRFDMEEHSLPRRFGIAAEHHARVVVWLTESPAELTVSIGDARDQRLFERTIAITDASRSVLYEETAVLVRSTLVALGFGAEIGRELAPEEIAPEPEPVAEEEPTQPEPEARVEPISEEVRATEETSFEGALGFGVGLDGVTVPGAYGPFVRGGVVRARLLAGIAIGYAPYAQRSRDGVTLTLTRVEPVLFAGYAYRASERVELDFFGRAGLTVFGRTSSTSASSPFEATPRDTHVAVLLGAEVRSLFFVGRRREALALSLAAALDGVLRRARFTVGDDATNTRFGSVLPVVPRIDVGFVVRLPHAEGAP
jgi:hypothetical protein